MSAVRQSYPSSSTSVFSASRINNRRFSACLALKALVRRTVTFACRASYFAWAQESQLRPSCAQGAASSIGSRATCPVSAFRSSDRIRSRTYSGRLAKLGVISTLLSAGEFAWAQQFSFRTVALTGQQAPGTSAGVN